MTIEIQEIYNSARDVYEGHKKLEQAVECLDERWGVPNGTSRMYIDAFRSLKDGKLYKEMHLPVLCYFLEQIFIDDGKYGLRTALNALSWHIDFFEKTLKQPRKENIRKIRDDFSMKLLVNSSPALTKCPNCSHVFQGNSLNGVSPI
ncbi:MAG: hypothetical protein K8953_06985 [Proteobacteria bacterium]|nr:hypothetical protein [Pseudomonadota bacterium]